MMGGQSGSKREGERGIINESNPAERERERESDRQGEGLVGKCPAD